MLATVYAFALVTLWPIGITNLNSNTAFLASVIIGNGVNFGVIMLARYVEERRAGASIDRALLNGLAGSRVGTSVAALAAAAAYGSLSFTQFRGFRQFGTIGGVGMLCSWVCAYVLAPPLIAWLDRKGGSVRALASSRKRTPLMGRLAALVTHHPTPIVFGALIVSALALVRVRTLGRSSIEYDFSHLRRADSHISGEAYWGAKMDDLLGRYLTPLVLLTDGSAEAAKLEDALRAAQARPPLAGVLDTVVSAADVVPRDQAAKIAVVQQIDRDLTPNLKKRLSDEQRELLARYLTAPKLEAALSGRSPRRRS